MLETKALPTRDELREFLREWYLHSRFEGRDGPAWGPDYSGTVVESKLEQLGLYGEAGISMYESRTGKPIKFNGKLEIMNADAPPPQIQRQAPSIGRVIHGQAW